MDYLVREHRLPLARVQGRVGQLWKRMPPAGIDPDEPLTMTSLCRIKGRFPAAMSRFCTTELKLVPMRAWLDRARVAFPDDRFVMVSGVRREESARRAAIACDRFHDDFMGVERWLPILDWTWHDVFETHRRHGVPPNPLYMEGHSRVGCYPCIMARKSELAAIAKYRPDAFIRLAEMETEVGKTSPRGLATFFSATETPKAYRSALNPKTGVSVPQAEDVRRWALGLTPRLSLFAAMAAFEEEGDDIEAPACTSVYGLCE